jgi:hypothetical protein
MFQPSAIALTLALLPLASLAQPAPAPAGTVACPALLQHTLPRLQDEKPQLGIPDQRDRSFRSIVTDDSDRT